MIPEAGQHVKCFMRSTMVLEGTVEEWSEKQVVLKSLDSESLMIIHRPLEDIMITKIVLEISDEVLPDEPEQVKQKIVLKGPSQGKTTMLAALKDVLDPVSDEELNKTNLKRLRELVVEQDRKLITQKRREHFGEPGAVKRAADYSNPFINRKSAYVPGVLPNTPGAIMAANHRKK